jgi:hypothetical protein
MVKKTRGICSLRDVSFLMLGIFSSCFFIVLLRPQLELILHLDEHHSVQSLKCLENIAGHDERGRVGNLNDMTELAKFGSVLTVNIMKHQESLELMEAKYRLLVQSLQKYKIEHEQPMNTVKPLPSHDHPTIHDNEQSSPPIITITSSKQNGMTSPSSSSAAAAAAAATTTTTPHTPISIETMDNNLLPSPTSRSRCTTSWLLIGISTVARSHKEEYLLNVLSELDNQLQPSMFSRSHPLFAQVKVLVRWGGDVKSRKPHSVYEQARQLYHENKGDIYLFDDGISALVPNNDVQDSPFLSSKRNSRRNILHFQRNHSTTTSEEEEEEEEDDDEEEDLDLANNKSRK